MEKDEAKPKGARIFYLPAPTLVSTYSPRKPSTHVAPGSMMMLRRAVRGIKCEERLRWVIERFDNLCPVLRRLSHHLTDIIPSSLEPEKSLLSVCLKSALHGWDYAAAMNETQLDCYKEFLRGLFKYVPQAIDWNVCINLPSQRVIWKSTDQSLSDWWNENNALPLISRRSESHAISVIPLSRKDIRALIAIKILAKDDIVRIEGGIDAIVS